MDPPYVREFLQRSGAEYRRILADAIRQEETNESNPHYLGWEWHEVRAYPARLMKLVVDGVIRIN